MGTFQEWRARIKYRKCNGGHNVVMCGVRLELSSKKEESEEREDGVNSDKPDDVALLSGQGGNCTILQTAKVQVSSSDGTVVLAQVMFGNGADISHVSSNFVERCKPQWITSALMPYSSFGGHNAGKNGISLQLLLHLILFSLFSYILYIVYLTHL